MEITGPTDRKMVINALNRWAGGGGDGGVGGEGVPAGRSPSRMAARSTGPPHGNLEHPKLHNTSAPPAPLHACCAAAPGCTCLCGARCGVVTVLSYLFIATPLCPGDNPSPTAAAPTCTCPTLRTPTAPRGTTWFRGRCAAAGRGRVLGVATMLRAGRWGGVLRAGGGGGGWVPQRRGPAVEDGGLPPPFSRQLGGSEGAGDGRRALLQARQRWACTGAPCWDNSQVQGRACGKCVPLEWPATAVVGCSRATSAAHSPLHDVPRPAVLFGEDSGSQMGGAGQGRVGARRRRARATGPHRRSALRTLCVCACCRSTCATRHRAPLALRTPLAARSTRSRR